MSFSGETRNESQFGRLHSYTQGSVSNTYYNAANDIYWDSNTGEFDENGSPDGLVSLGFAGFSDVLHYGGSLQAGYRSRFVFHLDGFASGYGNLADLSVTIAGNNEAFFETGLGQISTNWATQSYEINGITPQTVDVQFSTQFVLNTFQVPDGSNLSGLGDYSSTLILDHIDILDANGFAVSGVAVTSDSGTAYQVGSVPEPASMAVLGLGALGLLRRKRSRVG